MNNENLEMIDLLERKLANKPNDVNMMIMLASLYQMEKRYNTALELYIKLLYKSIDNLEQLIEGISSCYYKMAVEHLNSVYNTNELNKTSYEYFIGNIIDKNFNNFLSMSKKGIVNFSAFKNQELEKLIKKVELFISCGIEFLLNHTHSSTVPTNLLIIENFEEIFIFIKNNKLMGTLQEDEVLVYMKESREWKEKLENSPIKGEEK